MLTRHAHPGIVGDNVLSSATPSDYQTNSKLRLDSSIFQPHRPFSIITSSRLCLCLYLRFPSTPLSPNPILLPQPLYRPLTQTQNGRVPQTPHSEFLVDLL